MSALLVSALSADKTLESGLYDRGWRLIGLDTQKESMLALRRKPSARVVVSGLVVTLCHGTTGLADGAVDGRAGVRIRLG